MRIALRASFLSLTLLAALAAPANALEIFGNTNFGNSGRQFGPDPGTQFSQMAQGFTMGATSYDLSAVVIGLNLGATVPNSSQMSVGLFTNGAGNVPGSLIGSFNVPTLTPSTITAYTFNYAGTTTLTTGTSYWIVVQNIPTAPVFDWYMASGIPSDDPAQQNSSGVTYLGTRGTINGNAAWSTNMASASNLRFNVVVVPEPSTYALGLAGTLVMGAVARRKSRKTASA